MPSQMNKLGIGLAQGASMLGQLLMQDRAQQAAQKAEDRRWRDRWDLQQQAALDAEQRKNARDDEMVPLARLPMLGDVLSVPRSIAPSVAPAVAYTIRDMLAGKGQTGVPDMSTDRAILREEERRRRGWVDDGGTDPDIARQRKLRYNKDVMDYFNDRIGPAAEMNPALAWMLDSGNDIALAEAYKSGIDPQNPDPEAAWGALKQMLAAPEGYRFDGGDAYAVRGGPGPDWMYRDEKVDAEEEVAALIRLILGGAQQGQPGADESWMWQ